MNMDKKDQLKTPRNNGPANEPVTENKKNQRGESKVKQGPQDKK